MNIHLTAVGFDQVMLSPADLPHVLGNRLELKDLYFFLSAPFRLLEIRRNEVPAHLRQAIAHLYQHLSPDEYISAFAINKLYIKLRTGSMEAPATRLRIPFGSGRMKTAGGRRFVKI